MLDLVRTCYPGRIVSFDPDAQTATVVLAMERYHSNMDYYYKKVESEPIDDVPIQFMQCKGYAITMPIMEGDDCLVWFTHRGFEHWLEEGKMEAGTDSRGCPKPQLMRINDISDAFATVGFNPVVKAIGGFNMSALEVRNKSGTQKLALKDDGSIDMIGTTITCKADKIVLDASLVEITGNLVGKMKATFTDIVTAADFVMGGGVGMVRAAANKLSEIISRYTGHTHDYTDDGANMTTKIQNDA